MTFSCDHTNTGWQRWSQIMTMLEFYESGIQAKGLEGCSRSDQLNVLTRRKGMRVSWRETCTLVCSFVSRL